MSKDKERRAELDVPVLFLIFNRLNETRLVFEEIRKAKPKQLFIAADGPRTKGEELKTDKVRKYVLDNIDWDCEIKKLFRKKNLGCKYAVSGAIDWFFDNAKQGIILEDDCLPDQSFFRFCEKLLDRYRNDNRIMHISGTNVEGKTNTPESYFFSKTFNVWGWATWRRAWKHYDVEMKEWPKYNGLNKLRKLGYKGLVSTLKSQRTLSLTYKGKINTWDYQWDFSCRINNGLSIIPNKNLITNIGLEEGTHTKKKKEIEMKLKGYNLEFPLKKNENPIASEAYRKKYIKFFQGNIIKKLFTQVIDHK